MTDERAIIRKHSKSFALASRLLAPAARQNAERLYAWCRYADDAIDHAPNRAAAATALGELRAELDDVYSGRLPLSPMGDRLAKVVSECQLPRQYCEEFLMGLAMDVAGTRYRTPEELLVYCYRVAGVVGGMMCHALGVSDEQATVHAAHLGVAMQLTNICRDVAEDWEQGRLYLPLDGFSPLPPADQPLDDLTSAVAVNRLLDLAEQYYASADLGLQYLDRRSRLAVRVARTVYAAIGTRIRQADGHPSAGRAVVPRWQKVQAVMAAMVHTFLDPANPGEFLRPTKVYPFVPLIIQSSTPHSETIVMSNQTGTSYGVIFGLALVLAMATVLFVVVGLNPKNADYGIMPWVYSGLSAVGACVCWVWSGRQTPSPEKQSLGTTSIEDKE